MYVASAFAFTAAREPTRAEGGGFVAQRVKTRTKPPPTVCRRGSATHGPQPDPSQHNQRLLPSHRQDKRHKTWADLLTHRHRHRKRLHPDHHDERTGKGEIAPSGRKLSLPPSATMRRARPLADAPYRESSREVRRHDN